MQIRLLFDKVEVVGIFLTITITSLKVRFDLLYLKHNKVE